MVSLSTTISTPITFLEYSKSLKEQDPTRTFVENMVATSDVLAAMPFLPAQFGKRAYMDIGSLPAVGFRGLNEAGNQATGSFNLREEDTFFIDEYIFVDRAIIDRLGTEHRYRQEQLKSIALSQYCTQQIISGDNTSNVRTPNGLKARCDTLNVNYFTNSAAAGGGALSLVNVDKLYWAVNKPTHLISPRGLMPFWDQAARSATLTNQVITTEKNDFGRLITKYKGLPILYGYDPDDSPDMIPFTEVGSGGGGAVTASLYIVSFREGGFYGIEQTPMTMVPEGPVVGQPQDSTHVKWDWGLAREHPRAIARLSSITAATIVA